MRVLTRENKVDGTMVWRATILATAVLVTCPTYGQSYGRSSGQIGSRPRTSGGSMRVSGGRARVTTGRRLAPRRTARPRTVRSTRPRSVRSTGRRSNRIVVSSGRSRRPSRVVPTGRSRRVVVRQAHRAAPAHVTFATTHPCAPETTYRVAPQTTYRVRPESVPPPALPEIPVLPSQQPARQEPLGPRLSRALEAGDLEAAVQLARWADGDPRREQVLRNALFLQLPSPTAIQLASQRLRGEPRWRGVPGRDTLLRVMSSGRE